MNGPPYGTFATCAILSPPVANDGLVTADGAEIGNDFQTGKTPRVLHILARDANGPADVAVTARGVAVDDVGITGSADVRITGTASRSVDEVDVGPPGNPQTVVPEDGAWEALLHLPARARSSSPPSDAPSATASRRRSH